jgi:hypothetical protein
LCRTAGHDKSISIFIVLFSVVVVSLDHIVYAQACKS